MNLFKLQSLVSKKMTTKYPYLAYFLILIFFKNYNNSDVNNDIFSKKWEYIIQITVQNLAQGHSLT